MAKYKGFKRNGSGILKLPRFAPADVIDLSYKRIEALPNRIRIMSVYLKENNSEWQYQVVSETTGKDPITMPESFIYERMSDRSKPIYQLEPIKKMYDGGFRWAGFYPDFIANDKAIKLIPLDNVAAIVLDRSYNPDGKAMDGYLSIWVKYTTTICDDGSITNSLSIDGWQPIRVK